MIDTPLDCLDNLPCPVCGTTCPHTQGAVEVAPGVRISIDPPSDSNTRVGFSRAKGLNGLFSSMIRFFTKAPCSHTWILYYDSSFEADYVMEAHTTWRLIPYSDFKKKNYVVAVYQPQQPIDEGLKIGGRLLGSRYDAEGLLGGLWVIVGEWFKRKWHNPVHSSSQVFCSEGVARIMVAAKYPGLEGRPVEDTRPEHLLALLKSDGSIAWEQSTWDPV